MVTLRQARTTQTTDDPAKTYYTAQTATVALITRALTSLWLRIRFGAIDDSWARQRRGAVALVSAGQARAAALPSHVVSAVLRRDEIEPAPTMLVRPAGFAGYTSAGGDLAKALDTAPIRVKMTVARGGSPQQAMASGLAALRMVAGTEIGDASRDAMTVSMRAEPAITGYVRRAEPGACYDCALQDGKWFWLNQGFLRHPNCQCVHEPVTYPEPPGRRAPAYSARMAASGTPYGHGLAWTPLRLSLLDLTRMASNYTDYRRLLIEHGYARAA